VLTGWIFEIEALKRVLPQFVAVNPVTALCLVLIGIAFECRRANKTSNWARLIAIALALVVACVGALKLSNYVFGWPFPFDAFLAGFTSEQPTQPIPNQMAPNTALNFICVGLAVVLIDMPPRRFPISHLLVVCVSAPALLAIIGYAYGVSQFTRVSSTFLPMRLPTAFTFLVLSAGILVLRPDTSFAQLFAMGSSGRTVALRLLPSAIIFVFLVGWLRLYGERKGYFPGVIGTAGFVVILIFGLVALIWWEVASLNRANDARVAAELELLRSNAELETLVRDLKLVMNHASELICSIAESGRVISINAASVPLLGTKPEQMAGSQFTDLIHPDERASWESASRQAKTGFEHVLVTLRLRRSDATFVTIAWSLRWSRHYERLFCVGRLEGFTRSLRPWDEAAV
jgi:two-component system cell cycle sensor histidine kinase/response regulator CckA